MTIKKFNEFEKTNEGFDNNTSNEDKIKFLERVKRDLSAFRKAYYDLTYTCSLDSSSGINLNDILVNSYPEGWGSFDEMSELSEWVDESIEEINDEILRLGGSNTEEIYELTEPMQDKLDAMILDNGASGYELDSDNQVVFFVDGVGDRIEKLGVIPVNELL